MAAQASPARAVPSVAATPLASTVNGGWSNDIKDYVCIARLGKRSTNLYLKWYGSNAAVYRARLSDDVKARPNSQSPANGEFALKIVFNYDDNIATRDLRNQVSIGDISRSRPLHYFLYDRLNSILQIRSDYHIIQIYHQYYTISQVMHHAWCHRLIGPQNSDLRNVYSSY